MEDGDDDDHDEPEMEVDDEEKDEPEDDQGTSFLDSFYGLSSTDPRERALAAHVLLEHCLTGPEANVKDAAYALKRLSAKVAPVGLFKHTP